MQAAQQQKPIGKHVYNVVVQQFEHTDQKRKQFVVQFFSSGWS